MSTESIKVYGADWCPDCHRAKNYLEQQQVPFQWINVDQNDEAQAYVREMNDNKLIMPTILFPDGTVMVEPSNAALSRKIKEL